MNKPINDRLTAFQAQRRAGKKVVLVPNRPASVLLNEAMLSDVTDGPNMVSSRRAEKHLSYQQGAVSSRCRGRRGLAAATN